MPLVARGCGIAVATAVSVPVLAPVVLAEDGAEAEQTVGASRMVRPADLPIYEDPQDVLDFEYHGRERTSLEEGIGAVRVEVEGVIESTRAARERVTQFYETGKAHSMSTVDYLTDEDNIVPRAGAITVGGLAGLIIGARRRGGLIKKVLYTSTGVVSAASLCYPRQAYQVSQQVYTGAQDYANIGYNFVAGVKPHSKAPAPQESAPHPATVDSSAPPAPVEDAPPAPIPDGNEVRISHLITPDKFTARVDLIAQDVSDVAQLGFRLTHPDVPTDAGLAHKVPEGFGSVGDIELDSGEDSRNLVKESKERESISKVELDVDSGDSLVKVVEDGLAKVEEEITEILGEEVTIAGKEFVEAVEEKIADFVEKGESLTVEEVAQVVDVVQEKIEEVAEEVGSFAGKEVAQIAGDAVGEVVEEKVTEFVGKELEIVGEKVGEEVADIVEEKVAREVEVVAGEVADVAEVVAEGAKIVDEVGEKVESVLSVAEEVAEAGVSAVHQTPLVPEAVAEKVEEVEKVVSVGEVVVDTVTTAAKEVEEVAEMVDRQAEKVKSEAVEVEQSEDKREELFKEAVEFVDSQLKKAEDVQDIDVKPTTPEESLDSSLGDGAKQAAEPPILETADDQPTLISRTDEVHEIKPVVAEEIKIDKESVETVKETRVEKKGLVHKLFNLFSKDDTKAERVPLAVSEGAKELTEEPSQIEKELNEKIDEPISLSVGQVARELAEELQESEESSPAEKSEESTDSILDVLEPVVEGLAKEVAVEVGENVVEEVAKVVKEAAVEMKETLEDVIKASDVVEAIGEKVVSIMDAIQESSSEALESGELSQEVEAQTSIVQDISEEVEKVAEVVVAAAESLEDMVEVVIEEIGAIEEKAIELLGSEEKREEFVSEIIDDLTETKSSEEALEKVESKELTETSSIPLPTESSSDPSTEVLPSEPSIVESPITANDSQTPSIKKKGLINELISLFSKDQETPEVSSEVVSPPELSLEPLPTESLPSEPLPIETSTEPLPAETEPLPAETEPLPAETTTESSTTETSTEPMPADTEPLPAETSTESTTEPLAILTPTEPSITANDSEPQNTQKKGLINELISLFSKDQETSEVSSEAVSPPLPTESSLEPLPTESLAAELLPTESSTEPIPTEPLPAETEPLPAETSTESTTEPLAIETSTKSSATESSIVESPISTNDSEPQSTQKKGLINELINLFSKDQETPEVSSEATPSPLPIESSVEPLPTESLAAETSTEPVPSETEPLPAETSTESITEPLPAETSTESITEPLPAETEPLSAETSTDSTTEPSIVESPISTNDSEPKSTQKKGLINEFISLFSKDQETPEVPVSSEAASPLLPTESSQPVPIESSIEPLPTESLPTDSLAAETSTEPIPAETDPLPAEASTESSTTESSIVESPISANDSEPQSIEKKGLINELISFFSKDQETPEVSSEAAPIESSEPLPTEPSEQVPTESSESLPTELSSIEPVATESLSTEPTIVESPISAKDSELQSMEKEGLINQLIGLFSKDKETPKVSSEAASTAVPTESSEPLPLETSTESFELLAPESSTELPSIEPVPTESSSTEATLVESPISGKDSVPQSIEKEGLINRLVSIFSKDQETLEEGSASSTTEKEDTKLDSVIEISPVLEEEDKKEVAEASTPVVDDSQLKEVVSENAESENQNEVLVSDEKKGLFDKLVDMFSDSKETLAFIPPPDTTTSSPDDTTTSPDTTSTSPVTDTIPSKPEDSQVGSLAVLPPEPTISDFREHESSAEPSGEKADAIHDTDLANQNVTLLSDIETKNATLDTYTETKSSSEGLAAIVSGDESGIPRESTDEDIVTPITQTLSTTPVATEAGERKSSLVDKVVDFFSDTKSSDNINKQDVTEPEQMGSGDIVKEAEESKPTLVKKAEESKPSLVKKVVKYFSSTDDISADTKQDVKEPKATTESDENKAMEDETVDKKPVEDREGLVRKESGGGEESREGRGAGQQDVQDSTVQGWIRSGAAVQKEGKDVIVQLPPQDFGQSNPEDSDMYTTRS